MAEQSKFDWLYNEWMSCGIVVLALLKFMMEIPRTEDEILTCNHASGLCFPEMVERGLVASVGDEQPQRWRTTNEGQAFLVELNADLKAREESRQAFEAQAHAIAQNLREGPARLMCAFELDGSWTKHKDIEAWERIKARRGTASYLKSIGLIEAHERLSREWLRLTGLGRRVLSIYLEHHILSYNMQLDEIRKLKADMPPEFDNARFAFLPDVEHLELKRDRKQRIINGLG